MVAPRLGSDYIARVELTQRQVSEVSLPQAPQRGGPRGAQAQRGVVGAAVAAALVVAPRRATRARCTPRRQQVESATTNVFVLLPLLTMW